MMEMERKVKIAQLEPGARRRRVHLGACPYCGGDVRLARDIYGVYRQCLQCSREIHPGAQPAPHAAPAEMPAIAPAAELLIA